MENFKASVQYNDLIGSVAADRADQTDAETWLKINGYIGESDILIGIKMWAGENHGTHEDPVSVHFFVTTLDGYNNIPEKIQVTEEPIPLKDIQVDMPINAFFALFKRFEVTLSSSAILEGRKYTTE